MDLEKHGIGCCVKWHCNRSNKRNVEEMTDLTICLLQRRYRIILILYKVHRLSKCDHQRNKILEQTNSSVIPRYRLFSSRIQMELSQNGIAFLDDQETVAAPTPAISTSHPFVEYSRSLHFYIYHFAWKEECVIIIARCRPDGLFLRIPNIESRFSIATARHPNHTLVFNLAELNEELVELEGL